MSTITRMFMLGLCSVLALGALAVTPPQGTFTLTNTLSDQAQRTTLAFSGLAMMTGNLEAQTFFPPGKVADYTGFQYLRDNDPDNMGHNTSFLTRVANNVIYILTDSQFAQLKDLAVAQQTQINQYGYQRYPLMKAFRRLLDGDVPSGSPGLDVTAVKQSSRALYLLDGQISFDRALLYANILNAMSSTQKAYLEAMKGKGWSSWPDISNDQISAKMRGLPQGTAVAVMTYAGDLFSWYAGSVDADVYFCPERHGTYFGSFYIKDAPAIGHEGYSIDEQLTATAGAALCDSTKGYVTAEQAAIISNLVEMQRDNLYAGSTNIVQVRTQIATLLRGLLTSTANSETVKTQVLALSGTYGDLDGEDNYYYATVFAQVYASLSAAQKSKLMTLRQSIMSGTYSDGTPFDFTTCTTYFLYSQVIADATVLAPYIANTDYLFLSASAPAAGFTFLPALPATGQTVTFTEASMLTPTSWRWSFGDGTTSTAHNPTHAYNAVGLYVVTLTAANAAGSDLLLKTVTVVNGYRPDLQIRVPANSTYSGDNVYNTTGQNQTVAQNCTAGKSVYYYCHLQNDGNSTDTFTLTGMKSNASWGLVYRDAKGVDITAAMNGTGWTSVAIPPGQFVLFSVQVTPALSVVTGTVRTVDIQATSKGDGTLRDVIKAVTTAQSAVIYRQPDLWLRILAETTYTGDNVYATDGTGQTKALTVATGATATYLVKVQNDGDSADAFSLVGTAGGNGWTVKYFTMVGNTQTDITTAMTGAGWSTGNLAKTGVALLWLTVTPSASVSPGSTKALTLTAVSASDAAKKDVAVMTTATPQLTVSYQPDLSLRTGAEAAYTGDGIYNTTGTGQAKAQNCAVSKTVIYYIHVQNDGTGTDAITLTGTAGNTGWTVQYLAMSTGVDITAQVTGSGYVTNAMAVGGFIGLYVKVTPTSAIPVGESKTLTLTATSGSNATKHDMVTATTTRL